MYLSDSMKPPVQSGFQRARGAGRPPAAAGTDAQQAAEALRGVQPGHLCDQPDDGRPGRFHVLPGGSKKAHRYPLQNMTKRSNGFNN